MAVQSARYKHPNSAYSQGLKDLIDAMLRSDPKQRPDIYQVFNPLSYYIRKNVLGANNVLQVIEMTNGALQRVS